MLHSTRSSRKCEKKISKNFVSTGFFWWVLDDTGFLKIQSWWKKLEIHQKWSLDSVQPFSWWSVRWIQRKRSFSSKTRCHGEPICRHWWSIGFYYGATTGILKNQTGEKRAKTALSPWNWSLDSVQPFSAWSEQWMQRKRSFFQKPGVMRADL